MRLGIKSTRSVTIFLLNLDTSTLILSLYLVTYYTGDHLTTLSDKIIHVYLNNAWNLGTITHVAHSQADVSRQQKMFFILFPAQTVTVIFFWTYIYTVFPHKQSASLLSICIWKEALIGSAKNEKEHGNQWQWVCEGTELVVPVTHITFNIHKQQFTSFRVPDYKTNCWDPEQYKMITLSQSVSGNLKRAMCFQCRFPAETQPQPQPPVPVSQTHSSAQTHPLRKNL